MNVPICKECNRKDKRIAELEAEVHQCPDCGEYCKQCQCTDKRIEELKEKIQKLRTADVVPRDHMEKVERRLKERVAALEAAILKNVDISWEPWKSLFPQPGKKP